MSDGNKKDRLFFHDLINQTHGMLLFLDSKNSLGLSDIENLKNEIKTLQSIAQNHYGLTHKNLAPDEAILNQVEKLQSSLEKLIELYFSGNKEKIEMSITGTPNGNLDFIPLYRVLCNIVKNMAEAGALHAQFKFEFSATGLSVETQNHIPDQKTTKTREGQGLHSIAALASVAGGVFQCELKNDLWVNHLFIPYQNSDLIKKIAA